MYKLLSSLIVILLLSTTSVKSFSREEIIRSCKLDAIRLCNPKDIITLNQSNLSYCFREHWSKVSLKCKGKLING